MLRAITSRLLVALGLGLIAIFAVQVFVRARFELPELLKLEAVADGNAVQQARRGFDNHIEHLESIAEDYGVWDDAYAFAAAKPSSPQFRAFVKSNLISSTLETNRINGMVYLDTARKVIYGVTSDLGHGTELSQHPFQSASLPPRVFVAGPLNARHTDEVSAGAAESNVGPILFAVDRILPTEASAKSRGYILVWRLMDQQFVDSLNRDLGLKLLLIPIRQVRDNPALLEKLAEIRNSTANFLPSGDSKRLYWITTVPTLIEQIQLVNEIRLPESPYRERK